MQVTSPIGIDAQRRDTLLAPGGWRVFLFSFGFALFVGLFVQIVLLPHVLPQFHAGHGVLLGGDWIGFHTEGARIARQILLEGWSHFELRPDGNAPFSLAALVYYATGIHEPWIILPVIAAVFALGAVALYNIFALFADCRFAAVALLPYLLFPTSSLLYSQIHKDVWSVTGFVWLLFVWTYLAGVRHVSSRQCLALVAIATLASASVWLVRPYFVSILLGALIGGTLLLAVWNLLARYDRAKGEGMRRWICLSLCFLAVGTFALDIPTKLAPSVITRNASHLFGAVRDVPTRPECERPPGIFDRLLPSIVRSGLDPIIATRMGQVVGGSGAGSAIDHNVCFTHPSDIVVYVPRALQIALFAPFPSMWFSSGVSPGSLAMRSIAGGEMLVSYILLIGIPLLFILSGRTQRKQLVLALIVTMLLIGLLAVAIPNVGTLYRMRYGYLQFLVGLGVVGWAEAWLVARARLSRSSSKQGAT